jgi:uncharacterized repeat protein (TIGR01451 family)
MLAALLLTVLVGVTHAETPAAPQIAYAGMASADPKGVAPPAEKTGPGVVRNERPTVPASMGSVQYPPEVEPNDTSATATPLGGTAVAREGNIFANGDIDVWSFTGAAGDRVYAATMTSLSSNANVDSVLELLDTDGTTILETDNDDGVFGATASSIAGATLPAAGTYFLRVRNNVATAQLTPYRLYFQLRSGTPTAETEPNDAAPGPALPAGGWVSGNTSSSTDTDFFTLNLNAGDTVFLSLDLDPERDTTEWNGQISISPFGTPGLALPANDAGATTPDSEALFVSVKNAGAYNINVGLPSGGSTFGTYHLSVTVFPQAVEGVNCTTYTSTNVPVTIPDGPGLVTSTLTVPGNPRIEDLDVTVNLTHNFMADLDVQLTAPGGNTVGLFSDIGSTTAGAQTTMDTTFDDEGAFPSLFNVVQGFRLAPELQYRLSWFDGQPAGGTWTMTLRDDASGDGGTLTGWSIKVCEPPPPPACPPGTAQTTVYTTDFESGAAGFTHSGAADEWELGTPSFAPITDCASGTNCWKTDLDNTYDINANEELLSPNINLAGIQPPIVVNWSQKFHMEQARFDTFFTELRQVGTPTNNVRLFQHLGATMNDNVGNPATAIAEAAGWGQVSVRADALAGQNVEFAARLTSDNTVTLAGLAIDDVSVTGCRAVSADLSITKTDGTTTATPGNGVTYTITASNAGPDAVPTATVADTFPATLTCTWTCTGAGGGTCTASGSGNINDSANLPVGGSATYLASCTINASATGSLTNTATVASSITDPNPANNSATDTDTLAPEADLAITKTDGVTTATPGGNVTYTITASNAGPSNAPGSTIADTFPAALTCTWTCVGAGGGTCTASGSGNISDTANLPAGGSTTYTASCNIAASATGTLSNTATVTQAAGINDPDDDDNTATDTDTLVPTADLSITKTDGVAAVAAGGSTTYTITTSNAGPSNATGATVADTFPAALTCTWTCIGAGGGTCTASGSGNINDTVNLPAGGSVTHTASCTVSASATGTLVNTATVTAPGGTTDPAPGNNSATDTDTIALTADLSITKTDGVTSATPGGSTTYTITASNAGPVAVTGATVSDTFAAALTCNWTCAGTGGGTCAASGAGNISDAVNLPVGAAVTYTAICAISGTATGSLVNTATVEAPGSVTDPVPGNNTATDTDALGAEADLSITKTDGVTQIGPGGSLTYTITAANAGPSAATGANIADTLPAQCVGATWTCAGSGGGTCAASGSGNIADTVNLPAAASVTYTVTCPVDAAATNGTVISNTATIAAPAGTTDPTPGNNNATDTTTVFVAPSGAGMSGTKTVTGTFSPGGTVTYTIVLSNAGPGPQNDNPGDEFTDVLPAALTLVSATATSGTAIANVGTNTATWNGVIAAAGSVTITITATVNAGASGSISNQGAISYDSDGNATNDAAAQTDDPSAGGAADPTVFAVPAGPVAIVPIPGLTPTGLLLLMLGIVLIGMRRSAQQPARRS